MRLAAITDFDLAQKVHQITLKIQIILKNQKSSIKTIRKWILDTLHTIAKQRKKKCVVCVQYPESVAEGVGVAVEVPVP